MKIIYYLYFYLKRKLSIILLNGDRNVQFTHSISLHLAKDSSRNFEIGNPLKERRGILLRLLNHISLIWHM